MHANYRQARCQQTDIDRLETMGYTETKISPMHKMAYPAHSIKLQAADVLAFIVEEQHLVRSRAENNLVARRTGQIYRTNLIPRPYKKGGILPSTIQKRAIITVTELQYPGLCVSAYFRRYHNPLPPSSPPTHPP